MKFYEIKNAKHIEDFLACYQELKKVDRNITEINVMCHTEVKL